MSRTRRHRLLAAACGVALLAGACSSDDDLPEGLRDIRDADPDASQTEPDEPDDGDEPDEPEPDPEPEPDGDVDDPGSDEPDGDREGTEVIDGVFLAEDAFQINDELDLDADAQRDLLDFALDAYLYTTRALNTGEWDEQELERFYSGEELTGIKNGLERYVREGLRQVNDGTVLEYLQVRSLDGAGIVINQCTTDGSDDGVIHIETGEYSFEPDHPNWLVAIHLALVPVDDDQIDYRIIDIGGASDDVSCP